MIKLAAGVVVLLALLIAAVVLSRQADWKVLYTNLGEKDGGAIIAQLSQMNVPYKYTEGGAAIMVPADRVYDVRLRLASQGLPKGSVTGFELMESNRLGITQFQEKLNFQRGLEGELTRSILAIAAVQNARVHLALPNQNGFFREQQRASASVLVTLYPGRGLDRAQIAGIVHLVSSSVPEMDPTRVSIIDDSGKLLSTSPDAQNAGADAQQLQYQQQVEQQYVRRILDLLEPIVGRDNVRAQVTAEVDFSQTEVTTEQYAPNLSPQSSAVRSQQVSEVPVAADASPPAGVPGAASNQPTAQAAAPINNNQPKPLNAVNGPPGGTAPGSAAPATRRDATTNYEVDRSVRSVRAGAGAIKRVNAAVVVNYRQAVDAESGQASATPLSPQQIEQMTGLVREAVGYSQTRGDSVNLMNAEFQRTAVTHAEVPFWKSPQLLDVARSYAWPLGLVLVALLVLLGVVRPAMKQMTAARESAMALAALTHQPPQQGGMLSAMVSDIPQRPALESPLPTASPIPGTGGAMGSVSGDGSEQIRIEDARQMARQNPAAVANIVKNWVHGTPVA